jgi:DNA-binding transcriptional MerR regulator
MVIYKEIERKRNILEQAEKLKKKGLNLKEIREIVGALGSRTYGFFNKDG